MYKLKTEMVNNVEKIISRPKKEDARQKEYIVIDDKGKELVKDKAWVRDNIDKIENVGLSNGSSLYLLNPNKGKKKIYTILDYIEEAKNKGQATLLLKDITVNTNTLEIIKADTSKASPKNNKELKNNIPQNNSISERDMKKIIKKEMSATEFVCRLNDTCAVVLSNKTVYGVLDVKMNKYFPVFDFKNYGGKDFDVELVGGCEDTIAFVTTNWVDTKYAPNGSAIWVYDYDLFVYKVNLMEGSAYQYYKSNLVNRKNSGLEKDKSVLYFYNKDLLFVSFNQTSYSCDRNDSFLIDLETKREHKNLEGLRCNIKEEDEQYLTNANSIKVDKINNATEIRFTQERHLKGNKAIQNLEESLEPMKKYIFDYECWYKSADNMYSSITCYSDGRPPKVGNYYAGEKPSAFWIPYKDRYMKLRKEGNKRTTIIVERTKSPKGKWIENKVEVEGRFKTLQDYDEGKTMSSWEYGY